MEILQTPTFTKQLKKLHNNQKKDLDLAVAHLADNPKLSETKKGDLSGIQVYKFTMVNQLTLIAYEWLDKQQQLILLALGSHENFYKKLKADR